MKERLAHITLFLFFFTIRSTALAVDNVQVTTDTEQGSTSASLLTSVELPTATAPLSHPVPNKISNPTRQSWCPSDIFCPGQLLQTVNLASVFADVKTFVDKPTKRAPRSVLSAFGELLDSVNNDSSLLTQGQLLEFVEQNFGPEGQELGPVELPGFIRRPSFLNKIKEPLVKAFSARVHEFWPQLARKMRGTSSCPSGDSFYVDCETTLITSRKPFIIPGGRFREQYYWDSYWIIKGLLQSELYEIVNATLHNFMDQIEEFGFIPNGGRIYYLNRSQPPMFINMLFDYVKASGDTIVLNRALPLAERELAWWAENRRIEVRSPHTKKVHLVYRYAVSNSAPRPESYLIDYELANVPDHPLSKKEQADLFAEMASGAESGWDYTSRFFKQPMAGLRSLDIRNTVPICLNSILYKAHLLLADLYDASSFAVNDKDIPAVHLKAAEELREAVLDLFWDSERLAFYDFNLTSSSRNHFFSAAHFYPLWAGVVPPDLAHGSDQGPTEVERKVMLTYGAAVETVLENYDGTFPATFEETGQQWDMPNGWPPHQQIILEALANVPKQSSTQSLRALATLPDSHQAFADQLQKPLKTILESTTHRKSAFHSLSELEGETWSQTLQRVLANRYMSSVLCSWHATGGSIPGMLERLPDVDLNITHSINESGHIFEKYSTRSVSYAGGGGEYEVQVGFGWTNGVALWVAGNYGDVLERPQCPKLRPEDAQEALPSVTKEGEPVETGMYRRILCFFKSLLGLYSLGLYLWPVRPLI